MQLNFKKVDSSNGNTNAGDMLFVNNDKGIYIVESDGSKTKYGGSEYTSSNKLSADFIKDGSTNKVVTETEKTEWNNKQPGNLIVIAGEEVEDHNNTRTTNYSVSDVQDAVDAGKSVLLQWNSLSLPLVFISVTSEFAIYCLTVAADSSLSSNMPTCVLSVVQRNNTATYTEYDFNSVAFTGETDPVFTASAAYGITATDITNWNNKVSNVQADWNATSGLAQILNKPSIPSTLDQIADGSTRTLSNFVVGSKSDSQVNYNNIAQVDGLYDLPNGKLYVLPGSDIIGDNPGIVDFVLATTNNIPTESTVSGWGFTKNTGTYSKPTAGIPATDLAADVITVHLTSEGVLSSDISTAIGVSKIDGIDGATYALSSNTSDGTEDYILATTDQIPTESTVSGWGYLKANDVSTKVDKSAAISSLSLNMNSSTYTVTLSGTMADGSTFTVNNPIDLPLESVVVNGSYNNSTKKVVLTLQNGNTVEFSVADLVAGLQSEITTSNKLTSDLIVEADPVFTASAAYGITATDITNWNNKVSNVQSDWNATTGAAVILNKPTIPTQTTDASVSGWGYIKSYTESDPVFTASAAHGITSTDISSWNAAASNYLPKSGGSLNDGASLSFWDSQDYHTIINGNYVEITNEDERFKVRLDSGLPGLWVEDDGHTLYANKSIIKTTSSNNSYTLNIPDSSGTIALTKDIPTDASIATFGYTKNTGTITGITMNGSSKGTSGVVDLGTVITSHAKHKLTTTNGTATAGGSTITYVESLTGTTTATDGDLNLTATRKSVTIPSEVTESIVSGWGFTKNTGTLTTETDPVFSASAAAGITSSNITTWNGKQDAISDLATIRSNASAGAAKVSANNSTITIQKNGTTVDSFTTNASSAKTINMAVNELPTVSGSDNGKILQVVNGQWTLVTPVSIYNGSGEPSNILGNNGDIYIQS